MIELRTDAELEQRRRASVGFIYNDFSGRGASGSEFNILHRADCAYLARANTNVPKIFFENLAEATAWLTSNRGREDANWTRCGSHSGRGCLR
jgi:hypothetical protein